MLLCMWLTHNALNANKYNFVAYLCYMIPSFEGALKRHCFRMRYACCFRINTDKRQKHGDSESAPFHFLARQSPWETVAVYRSLDSFIYRCLVNISYGSWLFTKQ